MKRQDNIYLIVLPNIVINPFLTLHTALNNTWKLYWRTWLCCLIYWEIYWDKNKQYINITITQLIVYQPLIKNRLLFFSEHFVCFFFFFFFTVHWPYFYEMSKKTKEYLFLGLKEKYWCSSFKISIIWPLTKVFILQIRTFTSNNIFQSLFLIYI